MNESACAHTHVCACVQTPSRLDAWFKSFAEGEHFDCNAACCVLKRGPVAAFSLVNCQDWSVKKGLRVKGVEGPH